MRASIVLAFALLTSGCLNSQISVITPRPNIVFTQKSAKSLILRIQSTVPDQFTTRLADLLETSVEGWRQTLSNGFRSGFAGYFASTSPGGPSDLRLEIERADLEWAPVGHTLAAHVIYRARLVDRDGHSIATAAGTATSKMTWLNGTPMEPCISSSVESMYEELTDKLLRNIEPPHKNGEARPSGSLEI